jgi:protoporphyrinogen oxidase
MSSLNSTVLSEVPVVTRTTSRASEATDQWAIVGGGLLGMTLAYRLAQHGKQVTLFEAGDRLGGLASPWELGNVVWDRHYHVTLLSDSYLRDLLKQLELEQDMKWVETRTGFYTDGQLYSLSNTLEFLKFPPLGLLDKLRLGATIFYASKVKTWRRLEKISVSQWLTRWSGRRTFEKIWLPLLRAKLGENYQKTSAAFIWATIYRMYAARRTGLKKEMFGYVPGGYARILNRFSHVLNEAGVRIKPRHKIRAISQSSSSGRIALEFQTGSLDYFDNVVLTIPSVAAPQVCEDLSDAEKARLNEVRYQGIVCASLLLKKPLSDFYVTNITDQNIPFTAVIEMSALVDRKHFGGHSLVYLPKYLDSDHPDFLISDDEIKDRFLAALKRMYAHFSPEDVLAFRVSRVRHVFPIPTLHYSEKVPPIETSTAGLYLVNSAQIVNGTLNVNETIQLAEQSLPKLLAHSSVSNAV